MPADGGRYGHNSWTEDPGAGPLRSLLRARFADSAFWYREDARTIAGRGQIAAGRQGLIARAYSFSKPRYVLTEKGKEFINAGR